MKHALAALLLTACTPLEEPPNPGTTDTTYEGTETSDSGTDDGPWGILLDVGPPDYGTETGGG